MNSYKKYIPEEVSNLPLMLKNSAKLFKERPSLTSVDGTVYTYEELDRASQHVAVLLKSAGVSKGDNVAILAENSPHWGIAYFGTLICGATTVPILPDFRALEVRSILEHAAVKTVFISGKLISRLNEGLPPTVEMVINTDDFQLLEIKKGVVSEPKGSPGELTRLNEETNISVGDKGFYEAEGEELASIIYTSGTTGRSKGVMLTHTNLLSNAVQSGTVHKVVPEDRWLSVLPLAHTYECTIGMLVTLLNGAMVQYIDKAPTAAYLGPVLKKLQPTTMLTVPLIIEKIYRSTIRPKLTKSAPMRFLMKLGPTRKLLSKAAVKKLMSFFGGQIRFFGVGGAPLAPDVEKFLLEGGFPYAIGYGLTETSPMVAGFNPTNAVFHSVGKVMEGVSVRIDNPDPVTKEGEIVVRGSNVMKGYYKDEEKTAEVFTEDGYFRTGDLGIIDDKDIIFIKGRSKNMILGANGENIYPEEIEAVLNSREIVSESLVMEYKGKLTARVHLKMEVMEEQLQHLKENAAEYKKQMQVKADEALEELMIHVNQHVARNSKLQMMILQLAPFEKTATHKIKRFLYL
ncbi:MAG: long-chain fatty acid--CoA ligase [Bacteroidetes bacterium]|nr:MAG: long-chain fatty acid--CoA ligase [Bacteroidota bacterium]RLD94232.1 MAG: long-chain fatty acid--CoA ligase [Bacteroidota bacterium]